nr:hypothetical protein [Sphingomonas sp.]
MSWGPFRDGFLPWAGLALGTAGFFLAHQIGTDAIFQDCRASPLIVILAVLIGLAVIGAGAFGSWRAYGAETETPARRLVSIVSLLASALYAIGIILPFIAALVIPRCWA